MKFSEKREELLVKAIFASVQAGAAILEVYSTDFTVQRKDDTSPLTLADQRAHDVIVDHLAAQKPDIPILSEEGKAIPYETRRSWEVFWLVDPLDGTKEFIKKNGEFTVNIALIRETVPVLGVIYVPVKDVLYFAAEGIGAYRIEAASLIAGKKLPVSALIEHAQKLPVPQAGDRAFTIVASRSHMSAETEARISRARAVYGDINIVSAGSSLKFCLVAEGTAHEYPRFAPTMEWDTAAGQAIVEQAGGVVKEKNQERLTYNKESLINRSFKAMVTNQEWLQNDNSGKGRDFKKYE